MKPEELNQKVKDYNRKMAIALILPCTILFGVLIALIALTKWLNHYLQAYTWISIPLMILVVTLFIAFLCFQSKKNEDSIPQCPVCNSKLPINTIPIIIATGNCTVCGNKIIEKSEPNVSANLDTADAESK